MPVPERLRQLSETISHPDLTGAGETKTRDGRWALLAVLRKGAPASSAGEIEKMAGGFPVVFCEDSGNIAEARPAYPSEGE